MNTTPPRPEVEADLDTRIALAEQRLIARESRLRSQTEALGHRVQQAVEPWRWVGPVIGVAAVVWTVWRLFRRSPAAVPAHGGGVVIRGSRGLLDLPWSAMLALGWPLLPLVWRARMSQATAGRLLNVGLPLAQRALRLPRA